MLTSERIKYRAYREGALHLAKRQRGMTKKKAEKWIKEGRGQGFGIDYKPWLSVQDVPSMGRAHRETGIKIPRDYTFLSDIENRYFNILDYCSNVLDIREQYPLLPIDETMYIANEIGVMHPKDPTTGENIVMTTDFLITINENGNNKILARTVKYSSDLSSFRNIEKFEIERRYWEKQGVDWGIVTENEVSRIFADNIKAVRKYYDLRICGLFDDIPAYQIEKYLAQLAGELCGDSISVRDVCIAFDEKHGLDLGSSLALFKHLVITRKIDIDIINRQIELTKPIAIGLLGYGASVVRAI